MGLQEEAPPKLSGLGCIKESAPSSKPETERRSSTCTQPACCLACCVVQASVCLNLPASCTCERANATNNLEGVHFLKVLSSVYLDAARALCK